MITGHVTSDDEALLPVTVLGTLSRQRTVEALLDTGFNGFLTLPPHLVLLLGLAYYGPAFTLLADGSTVLLQKYEARVLWEGQERDILVLEAAGTSLLGMSSLRGSRVSFEVVDGGPVTIEPLP